MPLPSTTLFAAPALLGCLVSVSAGPERRYTMRVTAVQTVGGPTSGDPACAPLHGAPGLVAGTRMGGSEGVPAGDFLSMKLFTRGSLPFDYASREFPRGGLVFPMENGSHILILACDNVLEFVGSSNEPRPYPAERASTPERVCALLTAWMRGIDGPMLCKLSNSRSLIQLAVLEQPADYVVADRFDTPAGAARYTDPATGEEYAALIMTSRDETEGERAAKLAAHAALVADSNATAGLQADEAWAREQEAFLDMLRAEQAGSVAFDDMCRAEGCTALAAQRCSACHAVKYCGATCQREHWPLHRTGCIA